MCNKRNAWEQKRIERIKALQQNQSKGKK